MNTLKYTAIDDPKLQSDARTSLRHRFPALNEADIENLAGLEEVRLYEADRGIVHLVSGVE